MFKMLLLHLLRSLEKLGFGRIPGHRIIQSEIDQFDQAKKRLEDAICRIADENQAHGAVIGEARAKIDHNMNMVKAAKSTMEWIEWGKTGGPPASPWPRTSTGNMEAKS